MYKICEGFKGRFFSLHNIFSLLKRPVKLADASEAFVKISLLNLTKLYFRVIQFYCMLL